MDNFRRIGLQQSDIRNAIPFNRWADLSNKNIRKIYYPLVFIDDFFNTNANLYGSPYELCSCDSNGNVIKRKNGTNNYVYKDVCEGTWTDSSAISNNDGFVLSTESTDSHLWPRYKDVYLKNIFLFPVLNPYGNDNFLLFITNVNYSDNPSKNGTSLFVKWVNAVYGTDLQDIPYYCIDFQEYTFNGDQVAYQKFNDLTDTSVSYIEDNLTGYNTYIVADSYRDQYPLYYEEYQES